MKDNLIEFLFTLFANSLGQLQPKNELIPIDLDHKDEPRDAILLNIQSYDKDATRVLTPQEYVKMTKRCHQFLMRLKLWGVLDEDFFELVLNQIVHSESHLVTFRELQWIVKRTLVPHLPENYEQFLDLILSPHEDKSKAH